MESMNTQCAQDAVSLVGSLGREIVRLRRKLEEKRAVNARLNREVEWLRSQRDQTVEHHVRSVQLHVPRFVILDDLETDSFRKENAKLKERNERQYQTIKALDAENKSKADTIAGMNEEIDRLTDRVDKDAAIIDQLHEENAKLKANQRWNPVTAQSVTSQTPTLRDCLVAFTSARFQEIMHPVVDALDEATGTLEVHGIPRRPIRLFGEWDLVPVGWEGN